MNLLSFSNFRLPFTQSLSASTNAAATAGEGASAAAMAVAVAAAAAVADQWSRPALAESVLLLGEEQVMGTEEGTAAAKTSIAADNRASAEVSLVSCSSSSSSPSTSSPYSHIDPSDLHELRRCLHLCQLLTQQMSHDILCANVLLGAIAELLQLRLRLTQKTAHTRMFNWLKRICERKLARGIIDRYKRTFRLFTDATKRTFWQHQLLRAHTAANISATTTNAGAAVAAAADVFARARLQLHPFATLMQPQTTQHTEQAETGSAALPRSESAVRQASAVTVTAAADAAPIEGQSPMQPAAVHSPAATASFSLHPSGADSASFVSTACVWPCCRTPHPPRWSHKLLQSLHLHADAIASLCSGDAARFEVWSEMGAKGNVAAAERWLSEKIGASKQHCDSSNDSNLTATVDDEAMSDAAVTEASSQATDADAVDVVMQTNNIASTLPSQSLQLLKDTSADKQATVVAAAAADETSSDVFTPLTPASTYRSDHRVANTACVSSQSTAVVSPSPLAKAIVLRTAAATASFGSKRKLCFESNCGIEPKRKAQRVALDKTGKGAEGADAIERAAVDPSAPVAAVTAATDSSATQQSPALEIATTDEEKLEGATDIEKHASPVQSIVSAPSPAPTARTNDTAAGAPAASDGAVLAAVMSSSPRAQPAILPELQRRTSTSYLHQPLVRHSTNGLFGTPPAMRLSHTTTTDDDMVTRFFVDDANMHAMPIAHAPPALTVNTRLSFSSSTLSPTVKYKATGSPFLADNNSPFTQATAAAEAECTLSPVAQWAACNSDMLDSEKVHAAARQMQQGVRECLSAALLLMQPWLPFGTTQSSASTLNPSQLAHVYSSVASALRSLEGLDARACSRA